MAYNGSWRAEAKPVMVVYLSRALANHHNTIQFRLSCEKLFIIIITGPRERLLRESYTEDAPSDDRRQAKRSPVRCTKWRRKERRMFSALHLLTHTHPLYAYAKLLIISSLCSSSTTEPARHGAHSARYVLTVKGKDAVEASIFLNCKWLDITASELAGFSNP